MEKYRSQIDVIDDQIVKLYAQRMELAKEIGMEKARLGKSIDVPEREKAIINRLASQIEEDKKAEVGCQFCNRKYNYTESELIEVLENM